MRVTVVITNYNYADVVWKAINSSLQQTIRPKVVLVDDASTDNSVEVCGQLSKRPEYAGRLTILRKTTTSNPSCAKNVGIKHAWEDTDVYAFLDADDHYLASTALEALTSPFGSPKVGLTYADAMGRYPVYREPFVVERLVAQDTIGGDYLVSKGSLAKVGNFDESMKVWENYELATRIARQFVPIHVPGFLVGVGDTGRGLSHTVSKEEWDYYWHLATRASPHAAN